MYVILPLILTSHHLTCVIKTVTEFHTANERELQVSTCTVIFSSLSFRVWDILSSKLCHQDSLFCIITWWQLKPTVSHPNTLSADRDLKKKICISNIFTTSLLFFCVLWYLATWKEIKLNIKYWIKLSFQKPELQKSSSKVNSMQILM